MARKAVVVGSGPVGASVARRLAERGMSVLLIEAGAPTTPRQARGSASPPGSHLRNEPGLADDPTAFFEALLERCRFFNPKASAEGLPGAAESRNFGGQGILWTNNCPELQARLDRWDALDDRGWEERYAEARAVLGVRTDLDAGGVLGRSVAERLSAHFAAAGSTRRAAALPTAARRLPDGRVHWTAPADILDDLPPGVRSRIDIRTGLEVRRLERRGRTVAALVLGSGRLEDFGAVVIACGAVGNAMLLHASGIRPYALGRWLHYHPLLFAQVMLDPALCAGADADSAAPGPRLFVAPTAQAPWHSMFLRDIFPRLPDAEPAPSRRTLDLQFLAPVVPRAEHRIDFEAAAGLRFEVTLSEEDRACVAAMRSDMDECAQLLGRWRRGCEPQENPPGFSHLMGTTRMGRSPENSVVDPTGRVHGFDNLFVAGVGIVPVAIAVNPTLTAVALALVSADAIAGAAGC
ncbi:MAG: FAD-dependent oxidoreductase [Deltaproteobacteria bacterium]|nr:FAD-dependent oxidoreductase [Deltaproteobacteria bacterium]